MVGDFERIEYLQSDSVFRVWPSEYSNACVVFVHGFLGNALSTWGNLPTLLQGSAFARNKDIICYSYKTGLLSFRGRETSACIDNLVAFCETFLSKYNRVYFVTHSLGSVITLGSIPVLFEANTIWSRRIRGVIVLAPALWGSKIADGCAIVQNIAWRTILGMRFVSLSKLILELRSSSKILRDIRERWISYRTKVGTNCTIISGTLDNIVSRNLDDVKAMGLRSLSAEASHRSISKTKTLSDALYVTILDALYRFDGGNYSDRRQLILQTVYDSKKEDWEYDDEMAEFVYLPNFDIRINCNGDDSLAGKFREPWTDRFPDQKARREVVNIKYKGLTIKKSTMVATDGFRYLLPIPLSAADLRISRRQYNLAKIMEDRGFYRNLDQGLGLAGFRVDDSLPDDTGGL